MNDDEIKAKKAAFRAKFRAGLKKWKLWLFLIGSYIGIFAFSYLFFYVFMPKDALSILPILPNIAFVVANISIGFLTGFFLLLYIFCPVTGIFAMKLRGEH